MAGAIRREGWDLSAKVDYSQIQTANKLTDEWLAKLSKLEGQLSDAKLPPSLSADINKSASATASASKAADDWNAKLKASGATGAQVAGQVDTRMTEVSSKIDKATGNVKGLGTAYADAGKTAESAAQRESKAIKEIGKSAGEAEAASRTAYRRIGSSASTGATTIGERFSSAFGKVKRAATMATAGIGIGSLFGAVGKGMKNASALQQQYTEITNLAVNGGEKTAEVTKNVTAMQRQGQDMSVKYGKSQQAIAEGFEDLVKRGYSTGQALAAMRSELQASIASGDDLSDVYSVTSKVLEGFGMRSTNTAKMLKNTRTTVNELAYAADMTSTGFSDLGLGMSYSASIAKQAHVSLSQTAAALGVLSNNGLESTRAGTGLRSVILSLQTDAAKISQKKGVLYSLGLKQSDIENSNGSLKSLSAIMGTLQRAVEKTYPKNKTMQANVFKQLFGTEGVNAAEILAKNANEVDELARKTAAAGKQGKYVQDLANKNSKTAKTQMARAKQAMTAFSTTLGAAVLPAVNKASDAFAKFLDSKDGKKFQKDVGNAVGSVANKLVELGKWSATHTGMLKAVGKALLAGFAVSKILKVASAVKSLKLALAGIAGMGQVKADVSVGQTLAKGVTAKTALKAGTIVNGAGEAASFGEIAKGAGKAVGGKALKFGKSLIGGKLGAKVGGTATASSGASILAGVGVGVSAGYDIYNAVKSKAGSKARWKNMGKGLGTAIGGGIGFALGGPAGAAVGSVVGKLAGGWLGIVTKKFSKTKLGKQLGKSFSSAWGTVKKSTKSAWTSISGAVSKNWKKVAKSGGSMGKELSRDFKEISKVLAPVGKVYTKVFVKTLGSAAKVAATVFKVLARTVGKSVTAIVDVVGNVAVTVKDAFKVIDDLVHGRWSKAWKDAEKVASDAIDTVKDYVKDLYDVVKSLFGGIGSIVKSAWSGVKGVVSAATSWIPGFGKKSPKKVSAHATGGHITASHMALVGEAGPELAYRVGGAKARILGANGPEMTKISAGEHILNAKDTAKAMAGGIGRGLVLNGYARGTASFEKSSLRVWTNVSRDTGKLAGKTQKESVSDYSALSKKSAKELAKFRKSSHTTWTGVYIDTNKLTSKTQKESTSDYTTMRKGVLKQMDNLQDGVTSSAKTTASNFGGALDKMHTYARKAMGKTVSQLNNGIQSIDKVLSQFGGNSQVIKPVHFAEGTRHGHLTRDTLAVVNDAKSGPRQEAIVRSGKVYLPKGRDTLIPLKRGDEVLNGTQTQELAHTWGLPHFAKGTGVSKSRLRSIAKQGDANPGKAFNQDLGSKIKPAGPKLEQGMDSLTKNSAKSYGVPWMKAIWDVIVEKIGSGAGRGGTREAFEKYAEAHFTGKPYNMGSMGPNYYDCSGMVATALRHFGVDIGRTTVAMQTSPGVANLGKDLSRTTRGDLVIFGHGTGAAGHVGIIKDPATGTMFNETPPSARVSNISDDTSMGYSFYRVKWLHDGSDKSKKNNSKLEALAKRQLGPKALKWISRKLGESVGYSGSINLVGDQSKRIKSLANALREADPSATKSGIAAIIGNWLFESGLNPGIVNSIGASGLGQWLGGRLANLKAYAKKTGRSWSNAGTQISFALKGEGSDSAIFKSVLEGKGSVASLANRFSSEWERGGFNANHVAGAETVARTLGYASGGNPPTGKVVKVGEHGPELAEFKQPVHIYSASETKRKEHEATKLSKIGKGKSGGHFSSKPTISININGNISSENDAMKYAELIKQELTNLLSDISDEYGLDPSFY
ncbi:phage tail tape measure protein [Lactobacillus delbrueckii]|nr:phage tail tape measure protein [Lactobacillus delbrueckii]